MTIAAGFVCTDGILLASDTLYSGTGMGRKYGSMFWALEHEDVLVVFGGAGTEGGLLRTRDEINRKLRPGMSRIKVVDIIDKALLKVAEKLPKDPNWQTEALVAIRTHDLPLELYENASQSNMLSPVQHRCQCVGYAKSLGWYFASSIFRTDAPLGWAEIVAARVVRNVKEYSEYCEGDTHLVRVPTSGAAEFITDKTCIQPLEDHLAGIDGAMLMLMPGADPNASELSRSARLKELNEAIKRASGLAVGTMRA